jgi:hypothetical protein
LADFGRLFHRERRSVISFSLAQQFSKTFLSELNKEASRYLQKHKVIYVVSQVLKAGVVMFLARLVYLKTYK